MSQMDRKNGWKRLSIWWVLSKTLFKLRVIHWTQRMIKKPHSLSKNLCTAFYDRFSHFRFKVQHPHENYLLWKITWHSRKNFGKNLNQKIDQPQRPEMTRKWPNSKLSHRMFTEKFLLINRIRNNPTTKQKLDKKRKNRLACAQIYKTK